MSANRDPRTYRGCLIWPRNVHGMYWSLCNGRGLAADTLDGMRQLIRHELGR